MHELGITRNIVAIILEEANGKKVKRVTLEIGKLSAIIPDSIHFCFDICCKETLLLRFRVSVNVSNVKQKISCLNLMENVIIVVVLN